MNTRYNMAYNNFCKYLLSFVLSLCELGIVFLCVSFPQKGKARHTHIHNVTFWKWNALLTFPIRRWSFLKKIFYLAKSLNAFVF